MCERVVFELMQPTGDTGAVGGRHRVCEGQCERIAVVARLQPELPAAVDNTPTDTTTVDENGGAAIPSVFIDDPCGKLHRVDAAQLDRRDRPAIAPAAEPDYAAVIAKTGDVDTHHQRIMQG